MTGMGRRGSTLRKWLCSAIIHDLPAAKSARATYCDRCSASGWLGSLSS